MEGYQLKIVVKGSKPPIWRRVIIPQSLTFEQLHQIIQRLFGLEDYHLYEFDIDGLRFTRENDEYDLYDAISSDEFLDDYLIDVKKIKYWYDFGDDWFFDIFIEKELEDVEPYPQVIKFKGGYLEEDCGGIYGYYAQGLENDDFDIEVGQSRIEDITPLNYIDDEMKDNVIKELDLLKKQLDLMKTPQFFIIKQDSYYSFFNYKNNHGVMLIYSSLKDLLNGIYFSKEKGVNTLYASCYQIILTDKETPFSNFNRYVITESHPEHMPQSIWNNHIDFVYKYIQKMNTYISNIDFSSYNINKYITLTNNTIQYLLLDTKVNIQDYTGDFYRKVKFKKKNKKEKIHIGIACLKEEFFDDLKYYAVIYNSNEHYVEELESYDIKEISTQLIEMLIQFIEGTCMVKTIYVQEPVLRLMLQEFCYLNNLELKIKEMDSKIQDYALEDSEAYMDEMMDENFQEEIYKEISKHPGLLELLERGRNMSDDDFEKELKKMMKSE